MKPIPDLDKLLSRASKLGVFGTKMRSVINQASKPGISGHRQTAVRIRRADRRPRTRLCRSSSRKCRSKSPDKAGAERILLDELTKGLEALPADRRIMFKLTIPETPDSNT